MRVGRKNNLELTYCVINTIGFSMFVLNPKLGFFKNKQVELVPVLHDDHKGRMPVFDLVRILISGSKQVGLKNI